MSKLTELPDRGVVEIAGPDRVAFLQGLVSNDVSAIAEGAAVWAALLTPQGKWLADFFVTAGGERMLLDCERDRIGFLIERLTKFRMRAKAILADVSGGLSVYAAWNGTPDLPPGCIVSNDPRLPEAGTRILSTEALRTNATPAEYNAHRLSLGLPDGSRDMEAEKSTLLEAGFDELHGVSWSKGCYMGQELTARTKYRGLIKRRLVPVQVYGALPVTGSPILRDGLEVGTMRSGSGSQGLALLRLEAVDGVLDCDGATLRPSVPDWMKLPATQS